MDHLDANQDRLRVKAASRFNREITSIHRRNFAKFFCWWMVKASFYICVGWFIVWLFSKH